MGLSDMVLRAKVTVALMRDPRVSIFDIGVAASNGEVTLTGDADQPDQCLAAEEVARQVDGVRAVRNEVTCGVGQKEDTADLVVQRFLAKLDGEFEALPDQRALTMAGYLQWSLWMTCKFRLPDVAAAEDRERMLADATDQALARIAGHVGAPKALVALWILDEAERIAESPHRDAPEVDTAPLTTSPPVRGEAKAA